MTLNNDIAVLTLESEVRNAMHISPVCLPTEQENFGSQRCVVIGWGNRQAVLKELPVECLGDEACIERLRATKLGSSYQMHPSFFCAQSTDQSSCLIDGGGPLACRRRDGSYAVVGLLSWSVDDYSPDVYVRVQQLLDFIQRSQQETTSSTTRGGRATETAASSPPPSASDSVPISPSTATLIPSTTTTAGQPSPSGQPEVEVSSEGEVEESAKPVPSEEPASPSIPTEQQQTSTTQVIEPPAVRPVPIPPVVVVDPEEDQNEVADESKKGNAFAYSYSSSSE